MHGHRPPPPRSLSEGKVVKAMAAAPVAPAAGTAFKFTHYGSPDYTDATVLRGLGDDPWVHLEGKDHPLVLATSFAPWGDSPAVAPATASPG